MAPSLLAVAHADDALVLNDLDYYEATGVNVVVFSNWYDGLFSDSKISGIELIHHGVRTATNGDIRLDATPEQWDRIPEFVRKTVDHDSGMVEAFLTYPDYGFEYSIRARPGKDGLLISVHLPKPLPAELEGKAGLNLEFLPAAYFEEAWIMDETSGLFPLYPTGRKEQTGRIAPDFLASGQRIVLAPGNPERRVKIHAKGATLELYDGRAKAQNGWFVVRSVLPSEATGTVLEWTLVASSVDDWLRTPVIGHSQVGYHPEQRKVAVIELDKNDSQVLPARLVRVAAASEEETLLEMEPDPWGRYKRYRYLEFDFSAVQQPGVYVIEYGGQRTAPFRIASNVYDDIWHATLDIFFPVQMDHVLVNEAYRVWHGASHLDDARQAPVNHVHFDLYAQGPTTDTPFEPGEHIPGLNVGGWYDAGDYDIRTQSQYGTVLSLVSTWEQFRPERDTTLVDYDRKFVDLHVPDGKADILQQIEHGAIALLAQHKAVGHAIHGIIVPTLEQYTHLGDGLTMTDNQVYNPDLGELEATGTRSGIPDDRWAFTSRSSALNFGSAAGLAAASRALRGHNDELAEECLDIALRVWREEQAKEQPDLFRHGNTTGGPLATEEMRAAIELLVTTGEDEYARRIRDYLPKIKEHFPQHATIAVRALPYLDGAFEETVRELTLLHRDSLDAIARQNPYGVRITEGGWAGNGAIISMANTNYVLHKAFPDIINAEDVLAGLNYILGTHPHSDLSFVSGVGAKSKKVAYGMNRADFSFIAGGVVPGVLILKPDYPENKEDWPFLWGENEYVIPMGAIYLFLAHAARDLTGPDN
jgi:endoglucanase